MKISPITFSQPSDYFPSNPDWEAYQLEEVKKHATNKSYNELIDCLNALCGPKGYVKIIRNKTNDQIIYQIHLFFDSRDGRMSLVDKLKQRLSAFKMPPEMFDFVFDYQLEESPSFFCLKLCKYQSAALLGINIDSREAYNQAQNILQNANEFTDHCLISQLPKELLHKILLLLNFQELGCFALLNQKFNKLTKTNSLWRSIAESRNIRIHVPPIKDYDDLKKVIPAKNYVKDVITHKCYKKIVSELEFYKGYAEVKNLAYYCTKLEPGTKICLSSTSPTVKGLHNFLGDQKIEPETAICLASDDFYPHLPSQRIILQPHETTNGNLKWLLNILLYSDQLSEEDYHSIITEAIQTLEKLQIAPDYFIVSVGEWSNVRFHREVFEQWQSIQKANL